MNKIPQIAKQAAIVTLVIATTLIFAIIILGYAVQFRDDDKALAAYFTDHSISGTTGYYKSHNRTLRYLHVGDPQKGATILFIHGAPSSVSYFKNFFPTRLSGSKHTCWRLTGPATAIRALANPSLPLNNRRA